MKEETSGVDVALAVSLVPVAILLSPVIALYHGWAAAIIWGWFMVPLGAPALTTVQCGGVLLALNAMGLPKARSTKGGEATFWLNVTVGPLLALLGAWLFRAWFA